MTLILLFIIDRIPGCHFRSSEEDELIGQDLAFMGEEIAVLPITSDLTHDEQHNMIMSAKGVSPSTSMHGEKSIPQYQSESSPNTDLEAGKGQAS